MQEFNNNVLQAHIFLRICCSLSLLRLTVRWPGGETGLRNGLVEVMEESVMRGQVAQLVL